MAKIKYYHYTRETQLEVIIKSGEIKLAVESSGGGREKACAWVSSNPQWEETATKAIFDDNGEYYELNFKEQLEIFGCARIEVKPSVGFINWGKLKHVAKMDLEIAKIMEIIGIEQGGDPKEWFGSLKPIGIENWVKAEVYKNDEWIEYKIFE